MTEHRFATPTSVCSRPSGLRRIGVAAAVLAAALALLPGTSLAAVEFVTRVGTCDKIDTQNDNQRLSVQAGDNMRFEVWGDGIDIGRAVRVTSVGSPADDLVKARIVRAHSGAENLLRGCRILKGSVEVEVDSPDEAGATRIRTLHFRLSGDNESSLAVHVEPFSAPTWTFISNSLVQTPYGCLTKNIGTVVQDLNDTRMTITLPPGANGDTSNCTLQFRTRVTGTLPPIDVWREFGYTVTSPAHVRLVSGNNVQRTPGWQPMQMNFTGDVANIRGTTAPRSSTLTVATPNPNRSDTLTLVINPPPAANAFTQACNCRNQTTGSEIFVNDDFQCEIRLSQQPPAGGQLISIRGPAQCVASGGTTTYSSASGEGHYSANTASTFHQIAFRAAGGYTPAGTACASRTSPVSHTLQFWVGPVGPETGPAFTQCQIRIRQR